MHVDGSRYLRPKLHRIFIDSDVNDCWQTCAVNLYENVLFASAKAHAYIRSVESSRLAHFSDAVIHRKTSVYWSSRVKAVFRHD